MSQQTTYPQWGRPSEEERLAVIRANENRFLDEIAADIRQTLGINERSAVEAVLSEWLLEHGHAYLSDRAREAILDRFPAAHPAACPPQTALEEMRAHAARMCELLAEIRTAHQGWACHRLLSDVDRAASGRIAVEAGIALGRLKAVR